MKNLCYTTVLIAAVYFVTGCESSLKLNDKIGNLPTQFTLLEPVKTGVTFSNDIEETLHFNFINYPYMYNGGGVAAGDINNDGLIDLYFTANQGPNRLYLNQGNFKFKDITLNAGVADSLGWSTGVTMVDLNNDGYLDIYVSKAGALDNPALRKNLLYINQQDNTFKERAARYGLDDIRMGSQAYFFDYDHDGDLDMYQVNHPDFANENTALKPANLNNVTSNYSDHFYRNEGDGFRNVTVAAGLANYAYGLSASIGDFNNDGWEDIYVCNDFLQSDYLYINNQDGTFTDKALTQFGHVSQNSMGSDLADINNDGFNDLIVMEMSPEDHERSKSNMPSMSTEKFEKIVEVGYHYQYMINTLQLNAGNGHYSDIAQMAGVAKTDWSWSSLLADFDEDGYNDLLVTNGILNDLANSDFRKKIKSKITNKEKMTLDEAMGMIPSNKVSNYIFQNQGDLTFVKKSKEWGMDKASFSNGATYADLDNDGDLDVVINNAGDPAFIYRNNSMASSINVKLDGSATNTKGIGASVAVYYEGKVQTKQQYLTRGYLSSVSEVLHFGLGQSKTVDSLVVQWPDNKISKIIRPDLSSIVMVSRASIENSKPSENITENQLNAIEMRGIGIGYSHKDQPYDDFKDQLLLPHKLSQLGPFISVADVNDDGLDDFFVGGAAGQAGELYIQNSSGFLKSTSFDNSQKASEDLQSLFLDYDDDGDLDLYVVSGSYEFSSGDARFQDHLYENDGKGNFSLTSGILPNIKLSGQAVTAADIDNDGDVDLFVGGRVIPSKYPLSPKSYLLENVGGRFVDVTNAKAPQLTDVGMVTDAAFSDYDMDGDLDLVVVGEWSAIQILENQKGIFVLDKIDGLQNTVGLWQSLGVHDIDGDGDEDLFVGNLGLNAKYKIGKGKEFHIYADDFDQSGNLDIVLSNKYKGNLVPVRGLECSSEQVPKIKQVFESFQSFATASLSDIYGEEKLDNAFHIEADLLYSVFLRNDGKGGFQLEPLPLELQVSPIRDFEFVDIDHDGMEEVLVVGNLYESEVETVRYDASFGHVLKYEKGGLLVSSVSNDFFVKGNARSVKAIKKGNDKLILVAKNKSEIEGFIIK